MGLVPIHPCDEVHGCENYRCVKDYGKEGEPGMALAAIERGDGGDFAKHCDAAAEDCRLEETAEAGSEIGGGAGAEEIGRAHV